MNIRYNSIASAIASILACSLLAACGGGGGGAMVRSSPPPQSPPPTGNPPPAPPPPSTPASPCPAPVTGDCVVVGAAEQQLPGGRQSDHALIIGNESTMGNLSLWLGDDSRFGGGTFIRYGTLFMSGGSVRTGVDPATVDGTILQSNVMVGERGRFYIQSGGRTHAGILRGNVENRGVLGIFGRVEGQVENHGVATIHGTVTGNVSNRGSAIFSGVIGGSWTNDGRLDVGDPLNGTSPNRIDGDFRQSNAGILGILLPSEGPWAGSYTSTLFVGGRAELGGVLELRRAWYNDYGAFYGYLIAPLPSAPVSFQILHANGGVFGRFSEWRPGDWLDENDAPRPLFIEGNLRYDSHDVWFDLTRVSVQAAMAGQGFGGITLASAGNLDRALASADGFALQPRPALAAVQSSFLRSAGRLLWLDDAQQAARSLDSLAGSLHVDAMEALARDDVLARGIGARTLALHPGDHAGAWSRVHGGNSVAGFDQWLSPRLLVGASATNAGGGGGDASGGHAMHASPQAALYLRWFGNDGWYAGGGVGYAQHALALDRRIDLADGGTWNAHAQRRLGIASLDAEAGRRFTVGGATLAPYAWLGADVVRSERALEQGQTGFELALQANSQARLDGGVGVRLGKRWRLGDAGWLALDGDARYRQRLAQAGDPLRAAFVGVPDAWFDVPAHAVRRGSWLDLGLRGGFGTGWDWSLTHAGSLTGDGRDRRWQFGLQHAF